MYNDNFNRDKENTKNNDNVQKQQMGPGGFPSTPSGMPPQFRMEDMPRSAPPDFIPEAPRMERRQTGEPFAEFGEGRFRDERSRLRELRRCLFRFTFIWLVNGNEFWFFPTFIDGQSVMGFRWRRNRWVFDRINLRRILFFRCF